MIFANLFKKNKSVAPEREDEWVKLANFLGIDKNVNKSALNSATYYACMLIRCNALAKVPIKLKKYLNGNTEDDTTHQLYQVLAKRPNAFMSPHDFFWATEYFRLETGNAYWVKELRNGQISALHLLDSNAVSIIYDDAKILSENIDVYYQYTDSRRGVLYYKSDDIVHFKNFTRNGIEGTPIKKYILEVIDSERYGRKVIKQKYEDGMQDPIIVHYTGDMNEENQNRIRRKFSSLGGAKNAGKVIPLPPDYNITQLTTNLVNNQFFEIQNLTTRQIANAFGVKGFQLNDMEKSTYNNIEQQNKAFYSDTMQNVFTLYEQEIDYKLLFDAEKKQGYYTKFNADVMLRTELLSRYQAYQTGINAGFLQIAEVRKKEDLPFVPGTDKLFFGNGAVIPIEDAGKQYKGSENDETE